LRTAGRVAEVAALPTLIGGQYALGKVEQSKARAADAQQKERFEAIIGEADGIMPELSPEQQLERTQVRAANKRQADAIHGAGTPASLRAQTEANAGYDFQLLESRRGPMSEGAAGTGAMEGTPGEGGTVPSTADTGPAATDEAAGAAGMQEGPITPEELTAMGLPQLDDLDGWAAVPDTQATAAEKTVTDAIAAGQQPSRQDILMSLAKRGTAKFAGKPEEFGKFMQAIQKDGVDLNDLQEFGPQVGLEMGIPPEMLDEAMQDPSVLQGIANWWENAEWWQKGAVILGVPIALMGAAHVMFGEGGMGSMLAATAGLGAAAYGSGLLNPALESMGMTKWVSKPPEMLSGLSSLLHGSKDEEKKPEAAGAAGITPTEGAATPATPTQELAAWVETLKSMPPDHPGRPELIRQIYKKLPSRAFIPWLGNWASPDAAYIKEQYGQLPQPQQPTK
jgi:hypothetical protein